MYQNQQGLHSNEHLIHMCYVYIYHHQLFQIVFLPLLLQNLIYLNYLQKCFQYQHHMQNCLDSKNPINEYLFSDNIFCQTKLCNQRQWYNQPIIHEEMFSDHPMDLRHQHPARRYLDYHNLLH